MVLRLIPHFVYCNQDFCKVTKLRIQNHFEWILHYLVGNDTVAHNRLTYWFLVISVHQSYFVIHYAPNCIIEVIPYKEAGNHSFCSSQILLLFVITDALYYV